MNTPLPALPRRKLPTGIQSLAKLRQGDHYYVDKTGLAIDLIESGSYFFLSRPRRFGKSLLVDTFKELFEGNRALFEGLAAETRWDWTKRYPVIRISFSDGVLHSRAELDGYIRNLLSAHREAQGLSAFAGPDTTDIPGDFADLIRRMHQRAGDCRRDAGRAAQPVLGAERRRSAPEVRVPDGGVEVQQGEPVLGAEQPDGHHGGAGLQRAVRVHGRGRGHGVRAGVAGAGPGGAPAAVGQMGVHAGVSEPGGRDQPERGAAGGLRGAAGRGGGAADAVAGDPDGVGPAGNGAAVQGAVREHPHDWYRNNPLAGFEGHCASVFYSYFAALGLDIRLEDTTNHGRIDMAVLFRGMVFVFEFKVVTDTATGEALQQIKAKGYADKYRDRGEPVHLIGIEFSRAVRNLVGFEVETLAGLAVR